MYVQASLSTQSTIEFFKSIDGLILQKYTNATAHELFNLMLDIPTNLRPRHVTSTLNLTQFCIDTVMTIWHYHGGCQVGRVVDKNYKVLGIDALRVIDGSTFLKSPGTNLQATVMMLGRYMGQRILRERDEVGEKNEKDLSVSPIEDETNLCSSFPKNKL
uniref:Glucose-methanol-choline oxidoreductase C-terminal domain-containing protein n=1 Tax=Brassica oleracea var. oleracea TaxID=109376 RepID=A0A0D3EA79_BRAOL